MKITYLLVAGFAILTSCTQQKKKLPILGEREPVEKTVDGKKITDTLYQTIPVFSFINQDSAVVTDKDFDGKIYVADFFFTTCPSICPVMHRNLFSVYEKFKDQPDVKFLSHTIDFKYDTPAKLREYANKLGVKGTQWEFLRGSKDSVYTLAERHYKVAVQEDKLAPGGFAHQGWFILIDKEKRMRGAYDGTNKEQVEQMVADMHTLLNEYKD